MSTSVNVIVPTLVPVAMAAATLRLKFVVRPIQSSVDRRAAINLSAVSISA